MPIDFRTNIVQNRSNPEDTVFNSKAVGEPPFMLGMSVWSALKDAVHAVALENAKEGEHVTVHLDTPATPERVLWAMEVAREGKSSAVEKTVEHSESQS